MARPRALLFDFNGTLSQDEPLVCRIFGDLFAELGRPLSSQEYFARFAGRPDAAIVRDWLGRDFAGVDAVVDERIARYLAAAADGSTVPASVRDAVLYAAERVTVAVVSSAARREIEAVLAGAGIAGAVQTVVAIDDVHNGKPAPDLYVRALELLGADAGAGEAVAFEDTDVGIAAARAAGLRCIAVTVTLAPERLVGADEVVPAIDVALIRRLLA